MMSFPYRIALSGWFLVAVLHAGPTTLFAEETPPASAPEAVVTKEGAPPAPTSEAVVAKEETPPVPAPEAAPVDGQAPAPGLDLVAAGAEADMSYWDVASKLGLGLGLVVILAWGAVFLLRKSAVGQQFGGIGKTIRVAERTYLSPKKAIYLVEIGDRTLALGVTEEHISALSEWQAGELELAAPAPAGTFASQFKSLLKQGPQEGQSA